MKKKLKTDFKRLVPMLILAFFGIYLYVNSTLDSGISYAEMQDLFETRQVESFVIKDDTVVMTLKDGSYETCDIYSTEIFREDLGELVENQAEKGIISDYSYSADTKAGWLEKYAPYVLAILGFMLLIGMMRGMAGGAMNEQMMHFGDARIHSIPEGKKKVTFQDVAGCDEEKEELQEIVDFMKNPDKYIELGARIPKGVLLVGPPGTGKTLLAKAVAGEADVKFLSISGSDFVEMYVGVGASRVRDLFAQAKKASPAIVFIDEIDAVGRQRGSGLGGGHDEREQTLNQLLVEMDGFTTNEGVVVLAATNRVDILDPAILRPGRFDRQVYVGLPDIKGREEILKVHAKEKPLAEDVDLKKVAQTTPGFTGADLENLLNEAALLTGRRDEKVIKQDAIEQAVIKQIAGPEKKSRIVPEHERKLTAFHEAGHAIVMKMLPGYDPVHSITIVPRGQAGGMTISLPEEDRSYLSKRYLENEIVSLLGGRAAEQLMLGDISTGASNDIERATSIARKMVASYGMSEKIGTVALDAGHEVFIGKNMAQTKNYSEKMAAEVDEEIRRIVDEAMKRAESILKEHQKELEAVATELLEKETLTGEEFEAFFQKKEE